ncbi:MAG: iron-containing alcohol dehydrogenase [Clostridia bacterium]
MPINCYYMPTKVFAGDNVIRTTKEEWKLFGGKAIIITSPNSADKSGALLDLQAKLAEEQIKVSYFKQVEENPSFQTVLKAAKQGREFAADFVIGIGGGSPLDCAKAVAVLLKYEETAFSTIELGKKLLMSAQKSVAPLIAIPTTAGTGSEVTPYAVITDREEQVKKTLPTKIFPALAYLDPTYLLSLEQFYRLSTGLDALAHGIEGYLSVQANMFSDTWAEQCFREFARVKTILVKKDIDIQEARSLLFFSNYAGFVIAQTGTSLPHGLSYSLTVKKNLPHGFACALFLVPYLKMHPWQQKVERLLKLCNFENLEDLANWLKSSGIKMPSLEEAEVIAFAKEMFLNTAKLQSFPRSVSYEEIFMLYQQKNIV